MGFIDFILGADSDSGLRLDFTCPQCKKLHRAALTRLDGRFITECRKAKMSGQVQNWQEFKAAAAKGDSHGSTEG
jgi:hypothetical protein